VNICKPCDSNFRSQGSGALAGALGDQYWKGPSWDAGGLLFPDVGQTSWICSLCDDLLSSLPLGFMCSSVCMLCFEKKFSIYVEK